MTNAVKISLIWHRQDIVAFHKSAVQPQCKQTGFAIYSSVHIHIFERNSPHIWIFAHAQLLKLAIPKKIDVRALKYVFYKIADDA